MRTPSARTAGSLRWRVPDGSLRLYDLRDLPSGRPVKQLAAGPRALGSLAFHPGGRQIAVSHANGVQLRDLETGSVLADLAAADAVRRR